MKIEILLYIIIALLTITLLFTILHHEKYVYKVISPDDGHLEEELNLLGDKGCHLTTARRATSGLYSTSVAYEIIMECPK